MKKGLIIGIYVIAQFLLVNAVLAQKPVKIDKLERDPKLKKEVAHTIKSDQKLNYKKVSKVAKSDFIVDRKKSKLIKVEHIKR